MYSTGLLYLQTISACCWLAQCCRACCAAVAHVRHCLSDAYGLLSAARHDSGWWGRLSLWKANNPWRVEPLARASCAEEEAFLLAISTGWQPRQGTERRLPHQCLNLISGWLLHDHVRITGSCPLLSLAHTNELQVATCVRLCATNAADPNGCLAINYSPWYAKFPSHDPTTTGPAEEAEMVYFSGLLANVTSWLAAASDDVGVGAEISN